MKCLSCNREFNTDREDCPFCGEKIGEVESTSSAVVEPVNNTATSVPNNPVPNEPASSMITNNNTINNNGLVPLTITREKRFMGWAIPFSVFVDGVKVGDIKNGKSLSCQVGLGSHVVLVKCVEKDVTQNIVVTGNHHAVEVTMRATMGLLAAVADITNVVYK